MFFWHSLETGSRVMFVPEKIYPESDPTLKVTLFYVKNTSKILEIIYSRSGFTQKVVTPDPVPTNFSKMEIANKTNDNQWLKWSESFKVTLPNPPVPALGEAQRDDVVFAWAPHLNGDIGLHVSLFPGGWDAQTEDVTHPLAWGRMVHIKYASDILIFWPLQVSPGYHIMWYSRYRLVRGTWDWKKSAL